jgi:hypothetical protein
MREPAEGGLRELSVGPTMNAKTFPQKEVLFRTYLTTLHNTRISLVTHFVMNVERDSFPFQCFQNPGTEVVVLVLVLVLVLAKEAEAPSSGGRGA